MGGVSFGRVDFEGNSMQFVVVPTVRLRIWIVEVDEDISSVVFILSRSTLVARKAGIRRYSV